MNLDPTWFVGTNPYWYDTWVTLPLLSSLDYTGSEQTEDGSISVSGMTTGSTRSDRVDEYWEDRTLAVSGVTADANYGIKATVQLYANVPNSTADELYVTADQSNPWLKQRERMGYNGAVVIQLVAYDSFNHAVAGSTPLWLRSPMWGYDQYTEPVSLIGWGFSFVYPSEGLDISNGHFIKRNGRYVWNSDLTLKLTNVPPGCTLRLVTYKIANYGLGSDFAGGVPVMHMWEVDRHGSDDRYDWRWTWKDLSTFDFGVVNVDLSTHTSESIRSGASVEKELLLATSYTPAQFLLSYCKMFGLMFRKDPARKVIDILSRSSFYNGGTVDLQDKVDRDDIQVTPTAFNKHWYDFTPEESASEYGNDYKKQYGEKYGQMTVNTGYQFNAETEQVFKDSIYKGAVEVLERSDAFAVVPGKEQELIYNYKGYTYLLYNVNDPTDSFEVEVPQGSTVDLLTGMDGDTVYYDLFPKVQLHTADQSPADGDGVLLFFKGIQSLMSGSKSLGYRLTDDNGFMNYLNDNTPCWLISNSDYDPDDRHLMISVESCPSFGRYIVYGPSGYITKSLDYGEPKTLYIPGAVSRPEGTLYDQCWKDYIADRYSQDTRVVKCKVRWEGKMTVDDLRKFYAFDNCLWRIDKVEDFDLMSRGLTSVTFVKVNDAEAYGVTVPSTDPSLVVTLSSYEVPLNGGTVTFDVVTSDDGPWYAEYDPDVITIVPAQDSASTSGGTITIQPNSGSSDVTHVIYFFADPASVRVTITQKAYSGQIQYLGTSYPGGSSSDVVPDTGGTIYLNVIANGPWTLNGQGTMSQSAGTATQGTVVSVNIPANSYSTQNQFYYTLTMPNGTWVRSQYINQAGAGNPYIVATPYDHTSPLSGDTFDISVQSNVDWVAYVTYDFATLSVSAGTAGTSVVSVTVSSYTGDTRHCMITFSSQQAPGNVLATVYVTQEAYDPPVPLPTENAFLYKASGPLSATTASAFKDESGNTLTVVSDTLVTSGEWSPYYSRVFNEDLAQLYSNALSGNTDLTAVKWFGASGGTTEIGTRAFRDCTNLESVEIRGTGAGWLGGSAFYNCSALTSVTVVYSSSLDYNNPVEYIFSGCTSLVSGDMSVHKNQTYANWIAYLPALKEFTFRPVSSGTTLDLNWKSLATSCQSLETITLSGYTAINTSRLPSWVLLGLPSLKDVYWGGTVSDAQNIFTAGTSVQQCSAFTVHCSDGDYTVPSTL